MIRLIGAAVVAVAVLADGVGAADRPAIGSLENQKYITKFNADGSVTSGTYQTDTGRLFLSGPNGKLTIGNEDREGNVTIYEYGGDDEGHDD